MFSVLLVLTVCLFIGPLFESLPNCILGAILIVAVFPILKQFKELPSYWRVNKSDFSVWILTWLSVTILDIDKGLWVGIVISLLTYILRTYKAKGNVLVQVPDTELYQYKSMQSPTSRNNVGLLDIHVFKFDAPLYFASVDSFKRELYKKVVNPDKLLKKDKERVKHFSEIITVVPDEKMSENHQGNEKLQGNTQNKAIIILECSALSYIDTMGLDLLKHLIQVYHDVGVDLLFSNCSPELIKKMAMVGIPVDNTVFPTITDAVSILNS